MDNTYVDVFNAVIARSARAAANALGGVKGRALEGASRAQNTAGVPGNVDYDEDGEPPSRFRFGGPMGLPFA